MVQLKLKKPKAIMFDIQGTAAKNSFTEKILIPYFKSYTRVYLEENWGKQETMDDVEKIRQAPPFGEDVPPKIPPADGDNNKSEIIQAVSDYVNYCVDKKLENKALTLLRFHVWFDGFDKGKMETPVYSDVAIQIQKWRCDMGIRLFIFSNGWAEATRRFLSKTNHGDLNLLIDAHFDTTIGSPFDKETYLTVLDVMKQDPANVLFLTKKPEEARCAMSVGIVGVLVMTHRRNIEKLDEADKAIPRIRSFNELEFEDEEKK